MPMSFEATTRPQTQHHTTESDGQSTLTMEPRPPSAGKARPLSARSSRPPSARSTMSTTAGSSRPQSSPQSRPQSAPLGGRHTPAEMLPVAPLCRAGPAGGSKPQSVDKTGGRRLLPAELGLAAHRVLTLPSHVDTCDKGNECCWRWLAHAVLKEASWLREDMTATRQEYERAMHERTKLEHDVEAFAELRGAHSQVQQEYYDLKMEVTRSRNEVMKLGNTLAQKNSREMELERELAQASAARQKAMDREVAALQKADDASMKMNKALYAEEYLRKELLRLEDEKVKMSHELRETKRERDTLKKLAEKKGKPKSPKRKNSTRSGVPRPQ